MGSQRRYPPTWDSRRRGVLVCRVLSSCRGFSSTRYRPLPVRFVLDTGKGDLPLLDSFRKASSTAECPFKHTTLVSLPSRNPTSPVVLVSEPPVSLRLAVCPTPPQPARSLWPETSNSDNDWVQGHSGPGSLRSVVGRREGNRVRTTGAEGSRHEEVRSQRGEGSGPGRGEGPRRSSDLAPFAETTHRPRFLCVPASTVGPRAREPASGVRPPVCYGWRLISTPTAIGTTPREVRLTGRPQSARAPGPRPKQSPDLDPGPYPRLTDRPPSRDGWCIAADDRPLSQTPTPLPSGRQRPQDLSVTTDPPSGSTSDTGNRRGRNCGVGRHG